MNKNHIEPTHSSETAVPRLDIQEEQLATLFNQGWSHLINHQWHLAENIFAQIESHTSHYELDGLRASSLRQKARLQRMAEKAWQSGDLEAALQAFKQADDSEHAKEVYELLTIQEREMKAERLTAVADYQAAAWIYDRLLTEFPDHEKETHWRIKKESCWAAELMPYFNLGLEALQQEKWRTAYGAFTQIIMSDPYFGHNGRFAAAYAEEARKEVILWADQKLRQGQVREALAAYREIGHLARIENVTEFLRLRQQEEENAQQLEAEKLWSAAVAKYKYLSTLYYDENDRLQWESDAKRCLEEGRLSVLYEQAATAFHNNQWAKAERLFGQIVAVRPDYQQNEQQARRYFRIARWRKLISNLTAPSTPSPPPVQTGKLS